MTSKSAYVSYLTFLKATLLGQLIFTVPVISIILIFDLMDARLLCFILTPIAILSIPILSIAGWLMAKASNWTKTSPIFSTLCGVSGKLSGLFLGGVLGFHVFGKTGSIIGAILFYFLASAFSIPAGTLLEGKLMPRANHERE